MNNVHSTFVANPSPVSRQVRRELFAVFASADLCIRECIGGICNGDRRACVSDAPGFPCFTVGELTLGSRWACRDVFCDVLNINMILEIESALIRSLCLFAFRCKSHGVRPKEKL